MNIFKRIKKVLKPDKENNEKTTEDTKIESITTDTHLENIETRNTEQGKKHYIKISPT